MGKHLGKQWGNIYSSKPFQTILNHFFVYLHESRKIPFIYRHRRHFTAVLDFFFGDPVGTRIDKA